MKRKNFLALVFMVFALIFSTAVSAATRIMQGNLNSYNGHYYYVSDNGMDWSNAKKWCEDTTYRNMKGHLAVITSAQEQKFIENLLQRSGNKNSYWIGGYKNNNSWKWVTGENFSYTHWGWNQPDGDGTALMIYQSTGNGWPFGVWNDLTPTGNNGQSFFGTNNFGFICEFEPSNNLPTKHGTNIKGDVNNDGKVDIVDVGAVEKYLIGLDKTRVRNFANADANGNGIIDEEDKKIILDIYMNKLLETDIRGDANCDGKVDINDSVAVLNYYNKESNNLKSVKNADVTKDGRIDTADAKIIEMLAKGIKVPDSFDGYYSETNGNVHVYKVFNNGMTWQQARDYCSGQGGHLVTITSNAEQKEIEKLIQSKGNKNSYWIGGVKFGGTWKWITGENFSYTLWATWQPDGDGNALMIYRKNNPIVPNATPLGTWNDIKSDGTCNGETFFGANNFGFICEWDNYKSQNINPDSEVKSHDPEGYIDSVVSNGANQISVRGWAFDRDDLSASLEIHVYIGGPPGSGAEFHNIPANKRRDDLNSHNLYRGVGANHGFEDTINVKRTGNQIVYICAFNIGGGKHVELGHRNVYIQPTPAPTPVPTQPPAPSTPDFRVSPSGYVYPLNQPTKFYGTPTPHDFGIAEGTPVRAIENGTAKFYQVIGTYNGKKNSTVSYGNLIELECDNGASAKYAHLSRFEGVDLKFNSIKNYGSTYKKCKNYRKEYLGSRRVNKGEIIGYVGTTGNSSGSHLHFEFYINGNRQNINSYFNR